MFKKSISIITVALYIFFIFGCNSTTTFRNTHAIQKTASHEFKAKKLQQVELRTINMKFHKGKLLGLKGKDVMLLPFPYWNVEPLMIDIDDINSIALEKKESSAAKGCANGFAFGFLIVGIIGGLSSEYDEDYQAALLIATGAGLIVGALGTVIGALTDINKKSEFRFNTMSDSEKIKALQKIMGL
jgi:hypothetical protein